MLAWLAHHSTAEGKARFKGREHMTFAHRQHAQNCILLTDPGSECISVRVGKYSVITVGTRAGEDAGDKRILMDAHRLVCCLTSGPPPEPGAVAKHAKQCRSKACINPAHLSWGTQKANVKEGAGARAAAAAIQAGAVGSGLVAGAVWPCAWEVEGVIQSICNTVVRVAASVARRAALSGQQHPVDMD